jgi:hypothetical protein
MAEALTAIGNKLAECRGEQDQRRFVELVLA